MSDTWSDRVFTFLGGDHGPWNILRSVAVSGPPLPSALSVTVVQGQAPVAASFAWALRGVVSNERYLTRAEKRMLIAEQPPLDRPDATCAALIPVRKSAAWWGMTQDERRAIFEERSHHIAIGREYLPAVARRLHHSRDLGEPFDFITWFEYPPGEAGRFEELLGRLRETEEWKYVDREVDLRLERRAL
jgi:chlorite dismutase